MWKPVNANPGLKVDRSTKIPCIKMLFTAFVLCILGLFKLKTEGQTMFRKPHCKVTKLESKFLALPGSVNFDLAEELRF